MLTKKISRSQKISSLSKEAAVLFFMIIPHLDSYGKLNGNAAFIKGEVVPLLDWLDIETIEKCLNEIHEKTNLRRFMHEGCYYLHSLSWEEHQNLKKYRLGQDQLPDYPNKRSGSTQDLVIRKVK